MLALWCLKPYDYLELILLWHCVHPSPSRWLKRNISWPSSLKWTSQWSSDNTHLQSSWLKCETQRWSIWLWWTTERLSSSAPWKPDCLRFPAQWWYYWREPSNDSKVHIDEPHSSCVIMMNILHIIEQMTSVVHYDDINCLHFKKVSLIY